MGVLVDTDQHGVWCDDGLAGISTCWACVQKAVEGRRPVRTCIVIDMAASMSSTQEEEDRGGHTALYPLRGPSARCADAGPVL